MAFQINFESPEFNSLFHLLRVMFHSFSFLDIDATERSYSSEHIPLQYSPKLLNAVGGGCGGWARASLKNSDVLILTKGIAFLFLT